MRIMGLVACLFLTCTAPLPAAADSIDLTAAFAQTQEDNATFIERLFGPDASSPLSFTYSLNPSTWDFSYSLNPGEMYAGAGISLSGSGTYDAATQTWSVSSSGARGATAWTASGFVTIIPGGTGNLDSITSHEDQFTLAVLKGDIEFTGTVNSKTGKSVGKCQLTDASHHPVGNPYDCNDQENADGTTDYYFGYAPSFGFQIYSTSAGTPGTYTTTISAVPEPASLVLVPVFLLGIAVMKREFMRQTTLRRN